MARGTLIVLDVIPEPQAYRDQTPPDYTERRSWLTPLQPPRSLTTLQSHTVYLTPSTLTTPEVIHGDLWTSCRAANRELGCTFYEGIVMKRLDSLYLIQLRNPEETTPAWVKHRWHF